MCVCVCVGEVGRGGLSLRLMKWITFPIVTDVVLYRVIKKQTRSFQLCVCVLTLLDSLYAFE